MASNRWQDRKNERPTEDPSRTELEKLRADEWFKYRLGPELAAMQRETLATCREISALYPSDPERANAMLAALVAECGPGLDIRPPISIEYAERMTIGSDVFINADLMVIGSGRITIGNNVLIGPCTRFYTPNHSVHLDLRHAGWELGLPITLEDDVWLGGSVVICPGVTVGRGSVVGAGSVLTKDVPPGVVVAGNPGRVVRTI